MKHFRLTILFSICLIAGFVASASQRSTRLFDERDVVTSAYGGFCQDAAGSLWIGTQSGLLRFDGTNFIRYSYDENSENSLSDNRILKVMRDNSDRIWAATAEGLNLYDPYSDSFTRISLPGYSHRGYISDIFQMKNGDIIFMVAGVGLYVLDFSAPDGKPVAVKFMPQVDISRTVNTLSETLTGDLIGGNHSGDIVRISPNGQSRVVKAADNYIKTLMRMPDGDVLVTTTTDAWIWHVNDDSFTPISIPDSPHPYIDNATLAADGTVYFGTAGCGVYVLEPGSFELVPFKDLTNPSVDINRARISSVFEDTEGNLWLGCSHQGVIMAPQNEGLFNFTNMDRAYQGFIPGATVITVTPSAAGPDDVWVGLEDGWLMHVDSLGTSSLVHHFPGRVHALHVTPSGRVAVAVDNSGLYEFDPTTRAVRNLAAVKGNYIAPALTSDSSGTIYIGIHGEGVMAVDPATLATSWITDSNAGFTPRWISSLFFDSRGQLWLGLFGGLSVFDPVNRIHTSISDLHPALVKGVHNDIAEDPQGRIWVASSHGIYIIDPSDPSFPFTRLTTSEGLSDNYVSTISIDDNGYAWAATHDGINRISPDFTVTTFNTRPHVSDSGYFSSVYSPADRRVYFSGENGIASVNPEVAEKSVGKDAPGIKVSAIYLNDARVTGETLSAGGKHVLRWPDMDRLRISHRDNSVTLFVTTDGITDDGNAIFQWRIPGVIDQWLTTPPGTGRIPLPHLHPGTHKVELRIIDNGAISPVKIVTISVDAPWYLTLPARILYLVIFLALIFLTLRLMRQKNADRINEEKIKFFINISHEIRSPLTLILGPLEQLLRREDNDPETSRRLNSIHRNANRILALINQLLDIRKIEKGRMEIEYSPTEIVGFTRDLVDIFRPQADEKHIGLSFSSPLESGLEAWIDRNNFDKVLVNLISNAIKYTPDGGNIEVAVSRGESQEMGEYAEITVTDDGIGLDANHLPHLFDRFYQGKFNKDSVPLGFGIGLDFCRLLVDLHRGTISANNRTDARGSVFTVRIPLRPANPDGKILTTVPASTHSEKAAADTLPARQHSTFVIPSSPMPDAPRQRPRRASVRILVVDDDPEIRAYLREVLAPQGRVDEAVNGEDALHKIADTPYDLILSDVVMPGMDGLHLLRNLKSRIDTNHIPVILLSSKNEVADRMAAWDKGADGYLGKPFDLNELQALIDSALDNRLRLRGKFSGVQQQDDKIETPVLKGNDAALIERITQEISRHLDNPDLNVEKLCELVGMSRAHLNRKMKDLFGVTPSEFIRNMRLRKAAELLRQPDIDISQIAYSVGFVSQPHFSTAFKRFSGFSPSEFRQRDSDIPSAPVSSPDAGTTDD
ncbi:MAG: response regulator [Muribaculaceae bacterium]|nr:response regulator [Muribaculaceae bacterium]